MISVKREADICILGAGPAGIAAALYLAKNNVKSILLEKESFPRPKVCGDGISGKSLKALKILDESLLRDIEVKPWASPSYGVRFVSPNGKFADVDFAGIETHPHGFVCRRADFDNLLANRVRSNKYIDFHEHLKIDEIVRKDGCISLKSKHSEQLFNCKLCLIGTGNSISAVKPFIRSPEPATRPGVGVRAYYQSISGIDNRRLIEIHFLKELLPWYLWIFPLSGDTANVGLALLYEDVKKQPLSLKNLLFDVLERNITLKDRFRNATLTGTVGSGQLPYYTGERKISGDQYMLLGDAAGLVDPFTGEGIGNALLSGIIAAEVAAACLKKNDFSARETAKYDENIYLKMKNELDLGLRLQRLARNGRLFNLVIGKASKNKHVRDYLGSMIYDLNTMKKLTKPLFYFRLLLNI